MNKYDIRKLVDKKNPVILDIGCYNGKDSKELSDVLECHVHAFEPDPLSQQIFRNHNAGNKRLHLYPVAVGDIDGEIEFHQSNHPQSNSIRSPKQHLDIFPKVIFDELIKVQCIKLDTWYKQEMDGKIIDFIWADVNGAEKDLINGATEALKNTRFLYVEVAKKELYEGQPNYGHIERMLPDFKVMCYYNWMENFGNVLLKNTKL